MKVDTVIIKDKTSGIFVGFVKQFPGVCSQADSIDAVVKNLDKYLKHWLAYCSENSKLVNTDDVYAL